MAAFMGRGVLHGVLNFRRRPRCHCLLSPPRDAMHSIQRVAFCDAAVGQAMVTQWAELRGHNLAELEHAVPVQPDPDDNDDDDDAMASASVDGMDMSSEGDSMGGRKKVHACAHACTTSPELTLSRLCRNSRTLGAC